MRTYKNIRPVDSVRLSECSGALSSFPNLSQAFCWLFKQTFYPKQSLDGLSNELYSSDGRNGEFVAITSRAGKTGTIVVSALRARANFGKLLRRIDDERGSLVIEKRGIPRAVLLSIRDYVKLAAPEPEVLRLLGEESERNRTSALSSREIDKLIRKARSQKSKQ
jgi:prevent-host-death family protein